MEKEFSIIVPYYKRLSQIEQTFNSFKNFGYENFEVVVILDTKNSGEDVLALSEVIMKYSFPVKVIRNDKASFNPARSFNLGVEASEGKYLVLTNPECRHDSNVLDGLRKEFAVNQKAYVICACMSLGPDGNFVEWYQHSAYSNRKLHFCSSIAKENYIKIGGFDEQYTEGIAYEDDDFVKKVEHSNLQIVLRDDLVTSHLHHSRDGLNSELSEKNRMLFNSKWSEHR